MAEVFNLLRRVKSLDISPEQPAYSGVVIFAGQDEKGNNIEYSAGNRTGTVLEITNEWGSQAQADAIYRKIRGYKYQPYRATGSQLDPSVEIGDAVTVKDTYGGVFKKTTSFGRYASTDIEAPLKEEVEHEFQIQSSANRQYERFTRSVRSSLSITASQIAAEVEDRKGEDTLIRATLTVQAGQIAAEVEDRKKADESIRATLKVQAEAIDARVTKEGGDSSSFGWKLTATGWSVYGNGSEKFRVDKDGAYVNGEIRATTGKIGGFDIKSNYLSYNGQTWGGTNATGAYIGQSGIQLGKNFKVDMQGNLNAARGTFGSLSVDGKGSTVGKYSGSLSGCGGSVSGITGSMSTGINVGNKSIGTYVGDIVAGKITADYINAKLASAEFVSCKAIKSLNNIYSPGTIFFMRPDGSTGSAKVLTAG